ncbi:MotA/TolQ/ExbB proton channel family protein [Gemmatimonadota bacterium]
MFWFIKTGGPLMYVLVILAIVLVALIARKALQLYGKQESDSNNLERGLHAILFWGAFSAVLGVYAQISGLYRALMNIIAAADISPSIIAEGLAISFHTTLFGLSVFLLSGLAWFILYRRYRDLSAAHA